MNADRRVEGGTSKFIRGYGNRNSGSKLEKEEIVLGLGIPLRGFPSGRSGDSILLLCDENSLHSGSDLLGSWDIRPYTRHIQGLMFCHETLNLDLRRGAKLFIRICSCATARHLPWLPLCCLG